MDGPRPLRTNRLFAFDSENFFVRRSYRDSFSSDSAFQHQLEAVNFANVLLVLCGKDRCHRWMQGGLPVIEVEFQKRTVLTRLMGVGGYEAICPVALGMKSNRITIVSNYCDPQRPRAMSPNSPRLRTKPGVRLARFFPREWEAPSQRLSERSPRPSRRKRLCDYALSIPLLGIPASTSSMARRLSSITKIISGLDRKRADFAGSKFGSPANSRMVRPMVRRKCVLRSRLTTVRQSERLGASEQTCALQISVAASEQKAGRMSDLAPTQPQDQITGRTPPPRTRRAATSLRRSGIAIRHRLTGTGSREPASNSSLGGSSCNSFVRMLMIA